MPALYANNVAAVTAADIGPSDTVILLSVGQGAQFPAPGVNQWFWATLIHPVSHVVEVVRCNSRSGDSLTVVRGRDNTTATAFPAGSVIEMRINAEQMRENSWSSVAGMANGLAPLGADTKLAAGFLPDSVPLMVGGMLTLDVMPAGVATDAEVAALLAPVNAAVAGKLSKAGDTMGGTLFFKAGTAGAQMGMQGYGWNNGIIRWLWAMESDAALALYAYDSAGGSSAQVLRASGPNTGGGYNLRIGGNNAWHAGNFNPDAKANNYVPNLIGPRVLRDGFDGGQGLIWFGGNGPNLLFDGTNFSFTHNVYAPNLIGTSDETLKKQIRRAPATSKIGDKVELISWQWRRSLMQDPPAGRHRGVSAQKVLEYAPHHVSMGPDGRLGVDKAGLALEVAVDDAARIRKLEAQVGDLQALVQQLIKKTR